jgi:hypothetical protein
MDPNDTYTPDPEALAELPAPDVAFAKSDGHTFRGQPLKPFAVRRQFAAQAMGNRLLCGRVALDETGAYDGMFMDVLTVIYLCQCPESDVHLAVRKPDKVVEKALAWGEAEGMAIGSPAFNEACEIYGAIMAELHASQFETAGDGEGGGPKNG